MQVFLETERLVLRRFAEDDVENLVELDSDPDVMRFINGGRPSTREEIESRELPAFLSYYDRYAGYGFWAAIEKSTGQFIGWFHFRPADDSRPDEVELGYRLRRSAWGKGYASEGSRALIDKGFAELGVQRVFASTMVVNVASRRVMEKAGLRFVRKFHQPWPDYIEGEEEGDVEYALLRSEWERPTVTLREITDANRDEILALRVAPGQYRFVGSVGAALEDADEYPQAKPWYRAVYDGEEPVGFVMLSWDATPVPGEIIGPWFLWKLLIDERCQRRGYGRAVLRQVVEIVRHAGATELLTSYVPGEGGPWPFYERFGFVPTGERDNAGELILSLDLSRIG